MVVFQDHLFNKFVLYCFLQVRPYFCIKQEKKIWQYFLENCQTNKSMVTLSKRESPRPTRVTVFIVLETEALSFSALVNRGLTWNWPQNSCRQTSLGFSSAWAILPRSVCHKSLSNWRHICLFIYSLFTCCAVVAQLVEWNVIKWSKSWRFKSVCLNCLKAKHWTLIAPNWAGSALHSSSHLLVYTCVCIGGWEAIVNRFGILWTCSKGQNKCSPFSFYWGQYGTCE